MIHARSPGLVVRMKSYLEMGTILGNIVTTRQAGIIRTAENLRKQVLVVCERVIAGMRIDRGKVLRSVYAPRAEHTCRVVDITFLVSSRNSGNHFRNKRKLQRSSDYNDVHTSSCLCNIMNGRIRIFMSAKVVTAQDRFTLSVKCKAKTTTRKVTSTAFAE